jgi:hypothetical protein
MRVLGIAVSLMILVVATALSITSHASPQNAASMSSTSQAVLPAPVYESPIRGSDVKKFQEGRSTSRFDTFWR